MVATIRRRLTVIPVMCAVVAVTAAGPTAHADVANPPWPAQCPLKLAMLIDQSGSMAWRFGDVREAARNVVDSLRDKRSEVTVVGFGSGANVVGAGVDISDERSRHDLKDAIDDLDPDAGGTNWEAALTAVQPMNQDVVVLITDGYPTDASSGDPLIAAVAAADQLKSGGTRVVAVGIDLQSGANQNLAQVTGPLAGTDYFPSDTASLLRQLYQIVADSCGVPLAALPTPEPPTFPLWQTIVGALAGLLLLFLIGFALSRVRNRGSGHRPVTPSRERPQLTDPTISHSGLLEEHRRRPPAETERETETEVTPRPPARRSTSLDFLSARTTESDPPEER